MTMREQTRPAPEGNDQILTATRKWLALGRDVLITGDVGSGRSGTLQALATSAARRGIACVLLRAVDDVPLSAILAHPSFGPSRAAISVAEATAWLTSELSGRRKMLLVDDLDLLDERSVAVLLRALRAVRDVVLVATVRSGWRGEGTTAGRVVAERALAEEPLLPLGFGAMSRFVAGALGAPADVALTSEVLARSGGNPRVARALVDAARHARAIDCEQGVWRMTSELDDVPTDAVVHLLLGRTPGDQVQTLELVAWLGPLAVATMDELVDREVLDGLYRSGRLVRHTVPGARGPVAAVSPPALGVALRQRIDAGRALELAEVVAGSADRSVVPVPPARRDLHGLLESGSRQERAAWCVRAGQIADLVLAESADAEAVLHERWRLSPSVTTADAYLTVLQRRPARHELESVFTRTPVTGAEPGAPLLRFGVRRLRWARWARVDPDRVAALPGGRDPGPVRVLDRLVGVRAAVLDGLRESEPGLDGSVPAGTGDPWSDAWQAVVGAAALIDAGRPDLALPCVQAVPAGQPDAWVYARALQVLALMMAGEVGTALRTACALMEEAYAARDLSAIRVDGAVLAEVLFFAGRPQDAWFVLEGVLGTGMPGPVAATFLRRGLSIGATVLATDGQDDLAEQLLRELDGLCTGTELLHPLRPLAQAAIDRAAGDRSGASRRLAAAGDEAFDDGMVGVALLFWMAQDEPPAPAAAGRISAAAERVRLPLLDPYLQLGQAVLADDPAGAALALPQVSETLSVGMAEAGWGVLDRAGADVAA
ncbi:MAG TPA: hypothetical protein VGC67_17670, partial [Cellulomonas sp.]